MYWCRYIGISNISVCVRSFNRYPTVMPRESICLYQSFTSIYIIKCYVYNVNFIPKKFKIFDNFNLSLIKRSVIPIFVVSRIFDSSFSVKVFHRLPVWEMLQFLATIIWLSENPQPMRIGSIVSVYQGIPFIWSTTLDETCWNKSWISSKFKKWLNFSDSKFSPLPPNINVECGQVLLSEA